MGLDERLDTFITSTGYDFIRRNSGGFYLELHDSFPNQLR